MSGPGFSAVRDAIADIRKGRMVVVVDDQRRENEGDLVFAAAKSTPAKINFLAKHARGLICVALSAERAEALGLPLMVERNLSRHETAFTVSVEAKRGTTTGISAADRSLTAKALADDALGPDDFIRPGHIFPLKARRGGVLVRAGHTEAAVDLVHLAGLRGGGSAAVICEIMNEDGSMARLTDCRRFARKHGLKLIAVEDLIGYRRLREKLVRRVSSAPFATAFGQFRALIYEDVIQGRRHLALVRGDIDPDRPVRVRVQSECVAGDVFASRACRCGESLRKSLAHLAQHGGVFLYLRQDDPDRDLLHKLGEEGAPAAHGRMDTRTYGIGAQILFDLGARQLHLLTNHPRKIQALEGYGLKIARQEPLPAEGPRARGPRKAA